MKEIYISEAYVNQYNIHTKTSSGLEYYLQHYQMKINYLNNYINIHYFQIKPTTNNALIRLYTKMNHMIR